MRKPLVHERLHPHYLSIICLFSHMLFMLCVVYPFVNCFCLPIWASHVHSLVVYTLYIYLSVVSIFFFFWCFTCLFACLPISSLLMLHGFTCVLPCVSCIPAFVPLPPYTCYMYISHNNCFSFLNAVSHMPCTCPCIHMLFYAYLCTFLIHACFSLP